MLRGLYDFCPINDKTLGFRAMDPLLFLEPHSRDKNWVRCADSCGRIGFVPINFIGVDRETTSESLLAFLDEAIRRARRDRLHTIDLLLTVRENIITSAYTTEEHLDQIDREVQELRARSISELNYDQGVGEPGGKEHHHGSSKHKHASGAPKSPNQRRVGDFPQQQHVDSTAAERRKKKKDVGLEVQYTEVFHSSQVKDAIDAKRLLDDSNLQSHYVELTNLPPPPEFFQNTPDYDVSTPPTTTTKNGTSTTHSIPRELEEEALDAGLVGAKLVDLVRNATGLSHKLSQAATEVVVQFMHDNFRPPSQGENIHQLLLHLESQPSIIATQHSVVAQSPDARNMRKILNRLTICKEDEQQRSWALHEDEVEIIDHLSTLHSILRDADSSIPTYVMEAEGYRTVNELALYYQMETRLSIRAKLVDCFHAMCDVDDVDSKAHSVLLNSVLPMEIAREMLENREDGARLNVCGGLLVTLLSSGEAIPITHFEFLDEAWITFILATIETPPEGDDKLIDILMNLLYVYNLQFRGERDNLIIQALEKRSTAGVFTQKLIYFLNRGSKFHDAVLKLTTDTFTSKKAADLFYTNDVKVLIDILTRCITDLCPGDEKRTSYLSILQVVIRNCNYEEHKHRVEDLLPVFSSIQAGEEACPGDKAIVTQVRREFPKLFPLQQ